jgi:hypothetical protein
MAGIPKKSGAEQPDRERELEAELERVKLELAQARLDQAELVALRRTLDRLSEAWRYLSKNLS